MCNEVFLFNHAAQIYTTYDFMAPVFLGTMSLLPCEQRLHFRCVSWRAKSSLNRQPFNFLSCMCEIRHAIRKQNFVVRSVVKCCEFCGKKKIATTLICYARLAEWSKPIKNRKKTAFLIYSSRFLDGFELLQVC